MIAYPADTDARFFRRLAADGVLDRLTRFEESGEAGIHLPAETSHQRPSRQRSPSMASMITTGSVRGKCSAPQLGQSRR